MSDAVKLKKLLAKQQVQQFVIVNEEVVMVEQIRAKVTQNKPIYIGFYGVGRFEIAHVRFSL
jgi:hypothetical protein